MSFLTFRELACFSYSCLEELCHFSHSENWPVSLIAVWRNCAISLGNVGRSVP